MGAVAANGTNGAPPPSSIEKVVFRINAPVEGELEFDNGRPCNSLYDGDQVRFTLADGRQMYLPPGAAAEMERLEIRRGVGFRITKRTVQSGNRKGTTWIVERQDGWEPGEAGEPEKQAPATASHQEQHQHSNSQAAADPLDRYGDVLERTGKRAMDAVIAVEEYARSKGRAITFSEAQAQDIWISLFINANGGKR